MKKIVFFDIDGTLIDSFGGVREMKPRVKEAIRNLQSRGHYVFIATGRPYAFLNKEIRDFGFDGFVLANGAHVIINNKTIHSKPIDNSFVKELITNLDSNNVQYVLEGENYSYVKEEHKYLYDFYINIGAEERFFKRNFDIEDIDIHKVEMYCEDKDILIQCLEYINKYPEYGHFSSISKNYIELYFKESTKAEGILKTLEYLDIPLENSYAFGDGENDIEMLSTVGCGIAMGNASDKVKKYAKEITDTVHNDGVAIGIEKYVK